MRPISKKPIGAKPCCSSRPLTTRLVLVPMIVHRPPRIAAYESGSSIREGAMP